MTEQRRQLSDAARDEIREAIRIVREDRFEQYVRANHVKPAENTGQGGENGGQGGENGGQGNGGKHTPPPAKPVTDPPPETPRAVWGLYADE